MPAITSFSDQPVSAGSLAELEQAYPGGVNHHRRLRGRLGPRTHVPGSDVGPLFQAIMVNQFEAFARRRPVSSISNEKLGPAGIADLFSRDDAGQSHRGQHRHHQSTEQRLFLQSVNPPARFWQGKAGGAHGASGAVQTPPTAPAWPASPVELEDTSGDVLATTTTNAQGQYSFNQLSGPAANVINASGRQRHRQLYQIVLDLPTGMKQNHRPVRRHHHAQAGTNWGGCQFRDRNRRAVSHHGRPSIAIAATRLGLGAGGSHVDWTSAWLSGGHGPTIPTRFLLGGGNVDAHGLGLGGLKSRHAAHRAGPDRARLAERRSHFIISSSNGCIAFGPDEISLGVGIEAHRA